MFGLVDCNNFYASCERVFNPKLNNKPIVVLSNNDGCVIARSNEAKKIGVKMGEPAFKILSLIKKNNIHVFSTNFALYGDMSKRVMSIISEIIPNIEIYSIDEAFLDLTKFDNNNLLNIARNLRKKILQCTGIPVSIGIGRTKTLAKVANFVSKNDIKKNGVFMINSDCDADIILGKIDARQVWGVGYKIEKFLESHNINTALDLKNKDCLWMRKNKSIVGERIIKELSGIICYPLGSNLSIKKSICTSRTFGEMVTSLNDLSSSIAMYTARCAEKLRMQKSSAMLAHVLISTNLFRNDLNQYSNSIIIKFPVATNDTSEMLSYILKGLKTIYKKGYFYKKAGVTISGIIPNSHIQCNMFDRVDRYKSQNIMNTIDKVNHKMGRDFIRYASQGYYSGWRLKQKRLSRCYTTRWSDLIKINI